MTFMEFYQNMQNSYTDATKSAAVADVKFKKLPIRKAAEKYKVLKSSLSDRINGRPARVLNGIGNPC